MGRPPRHDAPGAIHHVMVRGLDGRDIFLSDGDRSDFLGRLRDVLAGDAGRCLAWCLMDNHVHLVIQTGRRRIWEMMKLLFAGYARAHNRRHQRKGPLYQDRYRSLLVDEDRYLLAVIRYVHLNPVRAGQVAGVGALRRHRWTGHIEIFSGRKQPLIDAPAVLGLFDDDAAEARRRLLQFMRDGMASTVDPIESMLRPRRGRPPRQGPPPPPVPAALPGEVRSGVVGSLDFVSEALAEGDARLAAQTRRRAQGWDISAVIDHVCGALELSPEQLATGGRARPVTAARGVIIALSVDELGESMAAAARAVHLSPSGATRAYRRGLDTIASTGLSLRGRPPAKRQRAAKGG